MILRVSFDLFPYFLLFLGSILLSSSFLLLASILVSFLIYFYSFFGFLLLYFPLPLFRHLHLLLHPERLPTFCDTFLPSFLILFPAFSTYLGFPHILSFLVHLITISLISFFVPFSIPLSIFALSPLFAVTESHGSAFISLPS